MLVAEKYGAPAEVSPAEDTGIRPRDVISTVDGKPLEDSLERSAAITSESPGGRVRLTLNRDGNQRIVTATLTEAGAGPASIVGPADQDRIDTGTGKRLGESCGR